MKLVLASPRGFCAGVNMAVDALQRAIDRFGAPLYVYHEIVHNRHVVEGFREQGVVFVDSLHEVPPGSHLMYSAHGVSPAIQAEARSRGLQVIDATCPLVRKVHLEAVRFARLGYTIVMIGHAGHDEIVGTLGEAPEQIVLVETPEDIDRLEIADGTPIAYLAQTTLSVDETEVMIQRLKQRFPLAVGAPKEDICYATQNRQEALKASLSQADAVLVVGSGNSSNTNRLAELARDRGLPAWRVDDVAEMNLDWFTGQETVVISAGASAPEHLVQACVARLVERFGASVEEPPGRQENVYFPLPAELR